jgi:hypothetical protein
MQVSSDFAGNNDFQSISSASNDKNDQEIVLGIDSSIIDKGRKKFLADKLLRQQSSTTGIAVMSEFDEPVSPKMAPVAEPVPEDPKKDYPPQMATFPAEFEKYYKMKKILPKHAVRQKMTMDGFTEEQIDLFFSGNFTFTVTVAEQKSAEANSKAPTTSSFDPSDILPLADPKFEKYIQMKRLLPEHAVRQKMMLEGFTEEQISAFFTGVYTSMLNKSGDSGEVPVTAAVSDPKYEKYNKMKAQGLPEGAIRQKMSMDGLNAEETENYFNPKPLSARATTDPRFEKYDKMKKQGLPEGAVRQKLIMDGFSATEIDHFFNPKPSNIFALASNVNKGKEGFKNSTKKSGPQFKGLYWKPWILSGNDQLKNTLFDDSDGTRKDVCSLHELDRTEKKLLASMFVNLTSLNKDKGKNGRNINNTGVSEENKENKENKAGKSLGKAKKSYLDNKQDMSVSFALKKLPEKKVFLESMITCSSLESITKETIDLILEALPEKSIIDSILSHPHYSELDATNQFLFSCYDSVPFFQQRCLTLQALLNYQENFQNFNAVLLLYTQVYEDIIRILPELKELFLIILKIGNEIVNTKPVVPKHLLPSPDVDKGPELENNKNEGNVPSENMGITFSAIAKCYTLKSNRNEHENLLHFIIFYINNHYPKEISEEERHSAQRSRTPHFSSHRLLHLFDSQANLKAVLSDPFDKFYGTFLQLKKDYTKLENDTKILSSRKEKNFAKLTKLQEQQTNPESSDKNLERDILKFRQYDVAYESLLNGLQTFLDSQKSTFTGFASDYQRVFEQYDSLLDKFGEKSVPEEPDKDADTPLINSSSKKQKDGEEGNGNNSNEQKKTSPEERIRKFLAKFVDFIEHYEKARSDFKNNTKVIHAELKKMESVKSIEVIQEQERTTPPMNEEKARESITSRKDKSGEELVNDVSRQQKLKQNLNIPKMKKEISGKPSMDPFSELGSTTMSSPPPPIRKLNRGTNHHQLEMTSGSPIPRDNRKHPHSQTHSPPPLRNPLQKASSLRSIHADPYSSEGAVSQFQASRLVRDPRYHI